MVRTRNLKVVLGYLFTCVHTHVKIKFQYFDFCYLHMVSLSKPFAKFAQTENDKICHSSPKKKNVLSL